MAKLKRRPHTNPKPGQTCRICKKNPPTCIVAGLGYAGSYCEECYQKTQAKFLQEQTKAYETPSEADYEIERNWGI